MTTLYKPVRIEYEDQAEALPIGTVGHEPPHLYAYIKRGRNYWRETGDGVPLTDYEMLPFTALVPIEAEEEHGIVQDDEGTVDIARDREQADLWAEDYTVSRRLVTPWEAA